MLEILVIVALIVTLWGYKKLPDLGRALGQIPDQFTSGLKEQDQ